VPDDAIEVRAATPDDRGAILAVGAAALGWRAGEPNEELFSWKHDANPFGASPIWVATDGGRVVAYRALLRWELERLRPGTGTGAGALRVVRAVDTATHPDHQGRGLFTRLTRHALAELSADGTAFVFNTPNDRSRPGYLAMGWEVVGRVPVGVTIGGPASALRLLRARVPAAKWSLDTTAGDAAVDVLADETAVMRLLARAGAGMSGSAGLHTPRRLDHLRWRYAGGPVRYRVWTERGDPSEGMVVFRLRNRGPATEAVVADVVVPGGDRAVVRRLLAGLRRAARPDYLLAVQHERAVGPSVRVRGLGPILTWRGLDGSPRPGLDTWDLQLGDLELF
jgi:hypothetical protein